MKCRSRQSKERNQQKEGVLSDEELIEGGGEGRGERGGEEKRRKERKKKKKGARVREEGRFIFSPFKRKEEGGGGENVRISETRLVCFLVYTR